MSESSDIAILDLLRKREAMTVSELAAATRVTSTAVRQRLSRLMAQGLIDRELVRETGRGRPRHKYLLTEKGKRKTGANFVDLAIALWQEIRSVEDPEVRRGLLARLAGRLAEMYMPEVKGATVAERMESLRRLFAEREVPFEVNDSGDLPVLTAVACPYPELAEQDRSICSLERMLFSEVLGTRVKLNDCRLDGHECCTFAAN